MIAAVFKLLLLCLAPHMQLSIAVSTTQIQALDDLNCTITNREVEVDFGWPYSISCNNMYYYDEEERQCLIFNATNHKLLLNETFAYYDGFPIHSTTDITTDIGNIYMAVIQKDKTCTLTNFTFNHVTLSNSTCEDSTPSVHITRLPLDRAYNIYCNDVSARVDIHADKDDFQTQWLYNCSSSLPKGVEQIRDHDTGRNKLTFPKVLLSHIGNFTCAVTYKNRTRYFTQHSTCIRLQPNAVQSPIVKCSSSEVLTDVAQYSNITLRCVATFGMGRIRWSTFTSTWTKEGSRDFSCINIEENVPARKNHVSCIYHIDNEYNDECIEDPDLVQRRNLTPATATVQLMLRNVGKSDLGRYVITIKTPRGNENATASVVLSYDSTEVLKRKALIIGLCVGLTTLVFIILGILYYFRFYVAVYTKRWFGSYMTDDKKYDIVFSYHFSTSDDKHARDQARTVISSIRLELDNLGYKLYDEHKDEIVGTRVVNVTTASQNSHRLLIVLTHDYIKDDWTMFHLQQGFKTMIESRYQMVFILVPGIKNYLEQHSRTDDTCRMIKRAVELNHQIDWPEKDKLDNSRRKHFRLQMEYAMPKLKHDRHHITCEDNNAKRFDFEKGQSNTLTLSPITTDEDHLLHLL